MNGTGIVSVSGKQSHRPRRPALLVMDMQRDFLEPGGRMPVAANQVAALIEAVNHSIWAASQSDIIVYYILNEFPKRSWLNIFRRYAAVRGSRGAQLDPRVERRNGQTLTKSSSSAFSNPELGATLYEEGVRTVALCGVFAEACVSATARSTQDRALQLVIISDAIAARSDAALARSLRRFERMGATMTTSKQWAADVAERIVP